jgi:hypothetical protein
MVYLDPFPTVPHFQPEPRAEQETSMKNEIEQHPFDQVVPVDFMESEKQTSSGH